MKNIKGYFKALIKAPVVVLFIVYCLIFLPQVIGMNSAGFRNYIMVGMGVDKIDNQIAVYGVTSVPSDNQSFRENDKLIIGVGDNFSKAVDNMSVKLGKKVLFGHVQIILIGKELAKQDLIMLFDSFIKTNNIRNSVPVVYSEEKLDKIIQIGIEIKQNTGVDFSELLGYETYNLPNKIVSNLDNFFKGYYSATKTSVLDFVSITDNPNDGVYEASIDKQSQSSSQSSQQNQSRGQQDSSSQGKQYLKHNGDIAIFKNGKFESNLSHTDLIGLNWLVPDYYAKSLTINNVTTQNLNNATIVYQVIDKKLNLKSFVTNGVPIINAIIYLKIAPYEMIDNSFASGIEPIDFVIVDNVIKQKINNTIKSQFAQGFNTTKQLNLDVLNVYSEFQNKLKDIKEFDSQDDPSKILDLVQFQINVVADLS